MIKRPVFALLCLYVGHLMFFNLLEKMSVKTVDFFLLSGESARAVTICAALLVLGAGVVLYLVSELIRLAAPRMLWLYEVALAAAGIESWMETVGRWAAPSLPFLQGDRPFALAILCTVTFAVLALWKWPHRGRVLTLGLDFLLLFALFIPWVWFRLAYGCLDAQRSGAPPQPHAFGGARQIWILLFDELDFRAVRAADASSPILPNLGAFRTESVHAMQASTEWNRTYVAISGLMTGLPVEWVSANGRRSLDLHCRNGVTVHEWRGDPSLLDDAVATGRRVSVVGWYYPYSRFFGGVVSSHAQTSGSYFFPRPLEGNSPVDWMQRLLEYQGFLPEVEGRFAYAPDEVARRHELAAYRVREDLFTVVQRGASDLVWVHVPLPHLPPIHPGKDYQGNLHAADHFFGAFRREMTYRGLWDQATVIVLADHPLRSFWMEYEGWVKGMKVLETTDRKRVPFMVKMPGQTQGLTQKGRFESWQLRRFVQALMAGQVKTPEQAAAWLDAAGEGAR